VNEQDMMQLSEQKYQIALEYKDAKKKYAEHKIGYIRLLGKEIMKNEKKAIDKIISLAMKDKEFDTYYKGYEYFKALAIGLEAELDAISTKIISIQSWLKYAGNNDGGTR